MSETDDLRTLLDVWKGLESAATSGPWFADGHCLMHDVWYANLDRGYRESLLNGTDGVSVPGWCQYGADAEFIAASRTLVPRLLAAVEAVLDKERRPDPDMWDLWDWGYDIALDEVAGLIRAALIGDDDRADRTEHDARCPHPKCPGGGLCCCLPEQGGQP